MKIMISQPMYSKTEEQIREEREKFIKWIEASGNEYVDTIFTEDAPKDCSAGLYYLAKSIEAIGKSDAVYFMRGWEKARGCRIEHMACVLYEKSVFYE